MRMGSLLENQRGKGDAELIAKGRQVREAFLMYRTTARSRCVEQGAILRAAMRGRREAINLKHFKRTSESALMINNRDPLLFLFLVISTTLASNSFKNLRRFIQRSTTQTILYLNDLKIHPTPMLNPLGPITTSEPILNAHKCPSTNDSFDPANLTNRSSMMSKIHRCGRVLRRISADAGGGLPRG